MSPSTILERYYAMMNMSVDQLFTAWRPSIPDSIDGKPLTTNLNDVFVNFPKDRLPANQWVAVFLRPEVMYGLLAFYLVSKPVLKQVRDAIAFNPKSESFRSFVAFHNLALAVFSGVCALERLDDYDSLLLEAGLAGYFLRP